MFRLCIGNADGSSNGTLCSNMASATGMIDLQTSVRRRQKTTEREHTATFCGHRRRILSSTNIAKKTMPSYCLPIVFQQNRSIAKHKKETATHPYAKKTAKTGLRHAPPHEKDTPGRRRNNSLMPYHRNKKRRPHNVCGRRSLRYAMTGRSLDFNLVAQFFLITLLLLWKAYSQNTVADVCRYVFSVDIVGQCERLFEL